MYAVEKFIKCGFAQELFASLIFFFSFPASKSSCLTFSRIFMRLMKRLMDDLKLNSSRYAKNFKKYYSF